MAQEQRLAGIIKSLAQRLTVSDFPVAIPVSRLKIGATTVPTLKELSSTIAESVSGLAMRSKGTASAFIDNASEYLVWRPAVASALPPTSTKKIKPESLPVELTPQPESRNVKTPFDEAMREVYMSSSSRQFGELLSFSGTTVLLTDDDDVAEEKEEPKKPALLQKEIKATSKLISKADFPKRFVASKASVDSRTRGLIMAIRTARSSFSKMSRTEELTKHLLQYPDAKIEAVRIGAIPLLLGFVLGEDSVLKNQTCLTLSLLGYSFPPDAPGPRILSVDGGGARGVVALEILRELETLTGKAPCDLFDYFIGVSTGALVAAQLAAFKLSADESLDYYKRVCSHLFANDTLQGARRLILSHGYYDTKAWEDVLKKNMGEKMMVDLSRSMRSSRFAVVSSKMDEPDCTPYIFRSYGLPCGSASHYEGSSKHKVWEACRASTAAPGFFAEFRLDGIVHQDGGLLTNNPTAIGIHECRLLWPKEKIQAVVSVGTGRFKKSHEAQNKDVAQQLGTSWRSKITSIIASATDTEGIHTILQDLMPPSTYFRIQPLLSQDFGINISEPEQMDVLIKDSRKFVKDNPVLMRQIAEKLTAPRPSLRKANDWMALQRDCSDFNMYHKE
ncbi:Calcium-independent phospholipase A2-gamma [Hypsibius exemplaris]|uniref:Calcium-independent phospholipase A2-gamma n=1 Tax=Hypsibius exemplaris TaxID=2072580 RepID=A0A1W0X8V5_HYPEX|nr:Calcium-independent phospholipase A2-gamma [Hypsibius exemplaris]